MSREREHHVRIPRNEADTVRRLQASAAAALERHRRAPVGDRSEAIRYEHLQTAINRIAFAELNRVLANRPSPNPSDIEVDVSWPFAVGVTNLAASQSGPKPVSQTFRSRLKRPSRTDASEERFARYLCRWLKRESGADRDAFTDREPLPVCPSEMPNRALSEGLRRFIASTPEVERVDARVVYQDGSEARTLPLRSLRLVDALPDDRRPELKVTLLSIRHMDLDAQVNGAWFRNSEISRRRPEAETDELAYQQSVEQLAALAQEAPLVLHMYQTGLPAANVGFYRAVADHHLQHRGYPVAVAPWYFRGDDPFDPGTIWNVSS